MKKEERGKSKKQEQDAASSTGDAKDVASKVKEEKGVKKESSLNTTDVAPASLLSGDNKSTTDKLGDMVAQSSPLTSSSSHIVKPGVNSVRSRSSQHNERGTSDSSDEDETTED